jgi:hypothetical protein
MSRKASEHTQGSQAISLSDPLVILAGIKQSGFAPDGSDIRDLTAAVERIRSSEREWCAGIADKYATQYPDPKSYCVAKDIAGRIRCANS